MIPMQTTPSLRMTAICRSEVLESGGTLTALDALEAFGCSRLASRITDLKRKGCPVASRMVTRRNRYGRLCRVAEYYMEV